MLYCAPEDLALHANLSGFSDAFILLAIEVATEFVDKRTGDRFLPESGATKLFNGDGTSMLLVNPKLRAVTSVKILDDLTNAVSVTLSADEFQWGPGWIKRNSSRMYRSAFSTGQANIQVIGDWGWETTPAAIKLATSKIATSVLTGKSIEGAEMEKLGNYTCCGKQISSGAIGLTVTDILEDYRLHKIIGGRVRGMDAGGATDLCPRSWGFIAGDD